MTSIIKKWGILPIRFDRNSVSSYLVILMASIEVVLSLAGLLFPDLHLRQQAFALLALYPGQAFYGYVTYAIVHGGFLHMLFNMMVFGQTGPMCERRMGHMRFFIFTVLAAIVAGWGGSNLAELIRHEPVSLVGFSGVVFAYLGAVFQRVIARSNDKWAAALDLLKRNILIALFIVVPLIFPSLGISGEAHLFGFIFGFLSAPWFEKR